MDYQKMCELKSLKQQLSLKDCRILVHMQDVNYKYEKKTSEREMKQNSREYEAICGNKNRKVCVVLCFSAHKVVIITESCIIYKPVKRHEESIRQHRKTARGTSNMGGVTYCCD